MVSSLIVQFVVSFATLDRHHYGHPSAVVWGDQVFALADRGFVGVGALYRGTLKPHQRRVRDPLEYENPGATKIDIRDSRVLFVGGTYNPNILSFNDLSILEWNDFGKRLTELHGYKHYVNYLNNPAACAKAELLFPSHRNPDVPAPKDIPLAPETARWPEFAQGAREFHYRLKARIDVQLAGPKTVRLFHAYKDTLFVSIEPDYMSHWRADPKLLQFYDNMREPPPKRELRTGKLPKEFPQSFSAYRAGTRDFLFTRSGKVFMVEPKGKAELVVTKIWDDPKRQLVGVVKDADGDAVYGWGFAGARESAERFRVKFEPKPVAVAYKRTVPLWDDYSDAYLESYECARALGLAAEKKE